MKKVYAKNRDEWRDWLDSNFDKENEVWLVYYKKDSGKSSVKYGESVEEALCYGWVDSIIKKIDESKYARKFTPRKESSKWSPSNKKRVEEMIAAGRMTEHGFKLVDAAKRNGNWDNPVSQPDIKIQTIPEFVKVLQKNRKAREIYDKLTPSHRRQYLGWIGAAKRAETRDRRIKESIQMLEEGKKLGLK